jgi:plasmid maintenance system antidote protein VapI
VSEIDPQVALASFVERYETQTDAAKALGIKPPYLSDLLHGHRGFSDRILKRLGLKRVVVSEKKS